MYSSSIWEGMCLEDYICRPCSGPANRVLSLCVHFIIHYINSNESFSSLCLIVMSSTGPRVACAYVCQVSDLEAVVEHPVGMVYWRLGSASQVTEPSVLTTMYLYWMAWPGVRVMVPVQTGLLEV